ncbi:hypothetical protein BAY59_10855 [Prauserella coralliicola]|nr:hypothetical protein BAY59_10855 [Prauserella coralliicola]
MYEDAQGVWWCEMDGRIHKNFQEFRVVWDPTDLTWSEVVATRGELWQVPEFTPCELGDAK